MLTTMAMQITKETYDVAAACLGPNFVDDMPKEEAIGNYVVINMEQEATHRVVTGQAYINCYMEAEDFAKAYFFFFPDEATRYQFCEIKPKWELHKTVDGEIWVEAQNLKADEHIEVFGYRTKIDEIYVTVDDPDLLILRFRIDDGTAVGNKVKITVPKTMWIKTLRAEKEELPTAVISVGMAIKITGENRSKLSIVNRGLTPKAGDVGKYLFFPYDVDSSVEILLKDNFFEKYVFSVDEDKHVMVDVDRL